MTGKVVARARRLRGEMNLAERLLWEELRNQRLSGVKFRRQHPVAGFVVDFACVPARLAIEVDGGVHALDAVAERDLARDAALARGNWQVLRLTDQQVIEARPTALAAIRAELRLGGLSVPEP